MNKIHLLLLLATLCLWGQICHGDVKSRAPALDYDLPREELEGLKSRALSGDSEASRRIANYSIFVESDEFDYAFWLRLSAEQGNCDSIIRYLQWIENRHPDAGASSGGRVELSKRLHLKLELCGSK